MQTNIPTGNVLQQSKVVCFNRPTSVRYSLYFVVVNELACCCREMVCRFFYRFFCWFFCRFFTIFPDFFEQRRWLKSIFCRFFWNSANNVIDFFADFLPIFLANWNNVIWFFCRFFADFFENQKNAHANSWTPHWSRHNSRPSNQPRNRHSIPRLRPQGWSWF